MNNNYGEKFREERIRLELTQSQVAQRLGLATPTISNRESKGRNFKVQELHEAYKVFGIDVGFGKVFDYIDKQDKIIEKALDNLSEKERNEVIKRDYKRISIYTLEKIRDFLWGKEEVLSSLDLDITEEEKRRLEKVLKCYRIKDGHIKRALKILEITQNIEKDMGRIKTKVWGERNIDIDIIDYDNKIFEYDNLVVPHIQMAKRSFVLKPMMDICQNYKHPKTNKSLYNMYSELTDDFNIMVCDNFQIKI